MLDDSNGGRIVIMKKTCIKRRITLFSLALTLLFQAGCMHNSAAEMTEDLSPVQQILSQYGYADDHTIQALNDHYHQSNPLEYNDQSITAQVQELLYDGVWLYSTTRVASQVDANVLILPAGADFSDQVQIADDEESGSYLELAKTKGSQLLAVYGYPEQFDQQGEYFLDYIYSEDGSYYLISGCRFDYDNKPLSITPTLQVYNVNLDTLKYEHAGYITSEADNITPFADIHEYYYDIADNDVIKGVTLKRTGITTYAFIDWKNQNDMYSHYWQILKMDDSNWPNGYALDVTSLYMEEIPEQFQVQIDDMDPILATLKKEN